MFSGRKKYIYIYQPCNLVENEPGYDNCLSNVRFNVIIKKEMKDFGAKKEKIKYPNPRVSRVTFHQEQI